MTHLAMIEGVVRALLFAKGRFNKKHYPYKNLKQGNNPIYQLLPCFLVYALNLFLVFAANRNAFSISGVNSGESSSKIIGCVSVESKSKCNTWHHGKISMINCNKAGFINA